MDRDKLEAFCRDALAHYGIGPQILKVCEEMSELDIALSHGTSEDVRDEIADVLIMTEQMRIAFGASAVDERIAFKIDRQRKRMEGGA